MYYTCTYSTSKKDGVFGVTGPLFHKLSSTETMASIITEEINLTSHHQTSVHLHVACTCSLMCGRTCTQLHEPSAQHCIRHMTYASLALVLMNLYGKSPLTTAFLVDSALCTRAERPPRSRRESSGGMCTGAGHSPPEPHTTQQLHHDSQTSNETLLSPDISDVVRSRVDRVFRAIYACLELLLHGKPSLSSSVLLSTLCPLTSPLK